MRICNPGVPLPTTPTFQLVPVVGHRHALCISVKSHSAGDHGECIGSAAVAGGTVGGDAPQEAPFCETAETWQQSVEHHGNAPLARPSVAVPLPMPATVPAATSAGASGWVLALSVVFAAHLGRVLAQEARLDVRRLQHEREQSRALSRELLLKRAAWKLAEEERSAVEDGKRVEEAVARSREEARRQAEKQRKYQEEAERESERIRVEREAARAQYEAEQARLDAEYMSRVAQEERLLEEARARAKREEEARRQEREERERNEAAARAERREAEQRAREQAVKQKLEARRKLESEKQRFGMRVEGTVSAMRPPRGTLLPGPLQKEASVRVAARASSLLGGSGDELASDFGTVDDAAAALPWLAGTQARAAADAAASALRLQGMTGQGPLTVMDEPELQHWMALVTGRAAVAALSAGEAALQNFGASSKAQPVVFQVRTEYGVLPPQHPQHGELLLGRVVSLVEAGEGREAVQELLTDAMEADNEAFYDGLPVPESLKRSPRMLGSALTLAHLLGRMLHDRPAKISDAPGWFEGAAALVRQQMAALTAGAPPDSLQVPATVLAACLGSQHPVAVEAAALGEANVSSTQRQLRAEQERAQQAALAEKMLAEEWPDEEELRAARMADKDAKTPVPERVWALRNVAGSLALGGAGERARARQLLERAVLLKQQFAGAADHPGALPELVALEQLLESEPAWSNDAAGVATLTLRVLGNVAAAYAQAGDQLSAAILLEAALRRYEEAAGVRSQAVRALTRRADAALEGLSQGEREVVAAHRQKSSAVVALVGEALTEKLGAYQGSAARSRVQEWDAQGAALIGPIRL